MINPVIVTIKLFGLQIPLRWYGVIVMAAVIAGALIAEWQIRRRGEKGDRLWDALIIVLPAGIVGARVWYVFTVTLGGNSYFLRKPLDILNIPQGGLHIFGGFLFGAIALLYYLRRNKLDPWLFLDAAGPAALIGQGLGRMANFINQELYGPPTTLPWGIPIAADHRLPQYPISVYPETTRFHPTFAYEMLWNIVMAGILLRLSYRREKELKPGTIFAGWLLAAGVGRTWIELFFRPDQPQIAGLGITYSAVFAALMAIAGAILLLARYNVIHPRLAEDWEEEYHVRGEAEARPAEAEAVEEEKKVPRARKVPAAKAAAGTAKKTKRRTTARKTTQPRGTRRATRAKKVS